ncbi:MAG: hypothetical protein WDO13_18500 [Verrucomicrobiota bacterium]
MSPPVPYLKEPDRRTALLLEVVDLLVDELTVLAGHRWENVAALKKRKVVLASRLRRLHERVKRPGRTELIDVLVADLDEQSQRKIAAQIDLIGRQMLALQELDQYWRECQSISFGKFINRPLGNDGMRN